MTVDSDVSQLLFSRWLCFVFTLWEFGDPFYPEILPWYVSGYFFFFLIQCIVLLILWEIVFYLFFATSLLIFSMKLLLFGYWTKRINPYVSLFIISIPITFLLSVHVLDFFDYILPPFHWIFIYDNSMLRF